RELTCPFNLFELLMVEFLEPSSIFGRWEVHFSPDAHYLVAGYRNAVFGYDLSARKEIGVPTRIRTIAGNHFAFKGPDEMDGFDVDGYKSRLNRLRFPSGDLIDRFDLPGSGDLAAAVQGDYLVMLHSGIVAGALIDLKKKEITRAYQTAGLAVYGDV